MTPAMVYCEQSDEIVAKRQSALDNAYEKHSLRFEFERHKAEKPLQGLGINAKGRCETKISSIISGECPQTLDTFRHSPHSGGPDVYFWWNLRNWRWEGYDFVPEIEQMRKAEATIRGLIRRIKSRSDCSDEKAQEILETAGKIAKRLGF